MEKLPILLSVKAKAYSPRRGTLDALSPTVIARSGSFGRLKTSRAGHCPPSREWTLRNAPGQPRLAREGYCAPKP